MWKWKWVFHPGICRYVINYSPYDLVYKLCKFAPVRLLARILDQVHVAHHVHHGVNYALKHYTGAYVIAVLVGIAKGIFIFCVNIQCVVATVTAEKVWSNLGIKMSYIQREPPKNWGWLCPMIFLSISVLRLEKVSAVMFQHLTVLILFKYSSHVLNIT